MHKNQLGLSSALFQYTIDHSEPEAPSLIALRQATDRHPQGHLQISPEQGRLLSFLIQLTGAKKALEIGTFTGYSAMAIALALPPDGHLITCDICDTDTQIARHHWQTAGLSHKITLALAPALETLDRLLLSQTASETASETATFDFAFIDADKGNYWAYFERILQLLKPNGLIAIDNTLWSGRVADPNIQDKSTTALREFNLKLRQHPAVQVLILPIGDGLTLARKRPTSEFSPQFPEY